MMKVCLKDGRYRIKETVTIIDEIPKKEISIEDIAAENIKDFLPSAIIDVKEVELDCNINQSDYVNDYDYYRLTVLNTEDFIEGLDDIEELEDFTEYKYVAVEYKDIFNMIDDQKIDREIDALRLLDTIKNNNIIEYFKKTDDTHYKIKLKEDKYTIPSYWEEEHILEISKNLVEIFEEQEW